MREEFRRIGGDAAVVDRIIRLVEATIAETTIKARKSASVARSPSETAVVRTPSSSSSPEVRSFLITSGPRRARTTGHSPPGRSQ